MVLLDDEASLAHHGAEQARHFGDSCYIKPRRAINFGHLPISVKAKLQRFIPRGFAGVQSTSSWVSALLAAITILCQHSQL